MPSPQLGGLAFHYLFRFGLIRPEVRLDHRPLRRRSEHRLRPPPPTEKSNLPKKYKLVKALGDEGGGCNAGILIVRSRKSNKDYIEKKMPKDWTRSGYARAEIDFLKQLRGHDYIVGITDYVIDGSTASIFFEYCEWGSMDDLIRRHRNAGQWISEKWLWKAFMQMAIAIDYCHNGPSRQARNDRPWHRITHLDLKPQNVLLKMGQGSTPDIKLCDFGAAMGGWQKFGGTGARTIEFKAPEHEPSTAADVWGVGQIMACASRVERVAQYKDGGPHCTEEFGRAIYLCLRNDPRQRVPSKHLAEMLSKKLDKLNTDKLKGASPIGPR